MSTPRPKLTFGVAFGAVAAAIGIAAAGYGLGYNMAEIAAAGATKEVGSSLRQIVPEGTSSEVITQLEAGDLESAAQLLAQGVTWFEEGPCVPTDRSVFLQQGASVTSCETGMQALFAGFFEVNYPDYATFTVGKNRRAGYPGEAFVAMQGRYPGCSLIYEGIISAEDPQQVKVAFDCPVKKEN